MNPVKINRKELSKCFWNRIFTNSSGWVEERFILYKITNELETLIKEATKPTGSIPPFTIFALYALTRYLQPDYILEIGTYIGKSTLAMAYALDKKESSTEIHTCDFSNSIKLINKTTTPIIQYNGVSTFMIEQLLDKNMTFTMLNIDGRFPSEDIDNLLKIIDINETVICLDDFEASEKGLINYQVFLDSNKFNNHALIYPPEDYLIKELSFTGNSTMAVLVPQNLIQFVRQ